MNRKLWLFFVCIFISINIPAQSKSLILPALDPTIGIQSICEPNLDEYIYISPRKIKDFTEALNHYGNCGYRLEKSNRIPLTHLEISEWNSYFFGVMKLDNPHKYEYQWFETYNPGQAQTRMNYRAEQGFYFKASYTFQILAENKDGDVVDTITNEYRSDYGTFFIFEKKDNETKKREYRVLDGDGTEKKLKIENQNKLNLKISEGFQPTGVFRGGRQSAIVIEKDESGAKLTDYLILNERWGVNKKLEKLSENGYKPLFIYPDFVLLIKINHASTPVTFQSFMDLEDLIKNPSKLTGRYYELCGYSYMNNDDLFPELYFSYPKSQKQIPFEYKFYKMTNVANRPKGTNKDDALREPPTPEMLAELQNLLKQDFVIREILASNEIYILFERPIKM